MKLFVCIKQVPDTETKIKLTGNAAGIESAGVKWVMSPYDEFAVEEAIKTRDKNPGAQVWVLTVGPKARAVEALRTALAMGADEAIVINAAENLDAYSTAKALSECIKAEGGAKVIFTGKMAIDQNQSSVGPMLAQMLNIPHTSVVTKFELTGENVVVERESEGGVKEIVQMMTPTLVGANKGLNMPRYASLPGIMKAKKKVIKELEASALGVQATDTKVVYKNFTQPPEKPAVKMLAGDASAQVSSLVQALRDEAKVL